MVSAGTSSSYRHGMNLQKVRVLEQRGKRVTQETNWQLPISLKGYKSSLQSRTDVWGSDVTVRVSKLGEKGDQLGKDKGSLQQ